MKLITPNFLNTIDTIDTINTNTINTKRRNSMKVINKIGMMSMMSLSAFIAQAQDVIIGNPSWPSASATANILKVVMEENLGLNVALQNGSNSLIFEAMDRNSMHVHPEVWLPNQQNLHDKYVEKKGTVVQNKNGVEAKQGLCITQKTSETHGIKSIYDLLDPAKAALFDTNGDGKGEMWAGQPGSASTSVEKIRAKSYGYDEFFELIETDTPVNWAALDAAVKAKKPYLFSCYTPHQVFSIYDLVFLDEPPHNAETWKVLQPTEDPDWLSKSSADSAWPIAYLYLHYAKSLEKNQPEAANLLANFKVDADILNKLSYSMVVDKKSAEDVAAEWVKNNSDIVESWLGQ